MAGVELAVETAVLAEPVEGWRTWALAGSRDGTNARLLPVGLAGKAWPPRGPARATCGRHRHHRVPDPSCTCGLHATHHPDILRRTRDPAVIGRVALWGRVMEHGSGYRAEHGYPQRLALVCGLCFWQWGTAASSPVEIVVRHRTGRLMPLCRTHLDLCRRFGYPVRRLLDGAAVERALLDTYAVEVLRVA